MSILRKGEKELFVVGATSDPESVKQVKEAIRLILPEAVLVQLCNRRASLLEKDAGGRKTTPLDSMAALLGMKTPPGKFLASVSDMLASLAGEVTPELRAAIDEAKAVGKEVVYADKDLDDIMQAAYSGFQAVRSAILLRCA